MDSVVELLDARRYGIDVYAVHCATPLAKVQLYSMHSVLAIPIDKFSSGSRRNSNHPAEILDSNIRPYISLSELLLAPPEDLGKLAGMLPANPVLDMADLPPVFIAGIVLLRYGAIIGLFVFFFVFNYTSQLKSTFISLNKNAGVCPATGSQTCCEVPQVVTGDFLADTGKRGVPKRIRGHRRACM
jgi:hypothetical protein